jgi:hypothetical protein
MKSLLTITAAALVGLARLSHAFTPAPGDSNDMAATLANQKSPFCNSRWIVPLDFGLEPGSFMSQHFPDWAASGARLGVPVELLFTPEILECIPDNAQGRLGNHHPVVYRVQVSPTFHSTFVSEKGEETVTFVGGGYSMDRSMMKTDTMETPKPRFLLRFWIDCISGAKRRDVELKPSTRIFGTIPIWDDPDQIAQLKQELATTKEMIKLQNEDDTDAANQDASFLDVLFGRPKNMASDESSLSYRQEQLERLLPLKGSVTADNGVTTAPKGSLVMPYHEKYLIVGSFAMRPLIQTT